MSISNFPSLGWYCHWRTQSWVHQVPGAAHLDHFSSYSNLLQAGQGVPSHHSTWPGLALSEWDIPTANFPLSSAQGDLRWGLGRDFHKGAVSPTKPFCFVTAVAKVFLPPDMALSSGKGAPQLNAVAKAEGIPAFQVLWLVVFYSNFGGTALENTNASGCPRKSLQVSHADGNREGVTLFLYCARFSGSMANTDRILFSRIGVLQMNSSSYKCSHKERKTEVCLCCSITLWHCFIYKHRYRHKPKCWWCATRLKQTTCRQKGASNCLAQHGFRRNPLLGTGDVSGVQSQGQGGAEVVKHCFILCLSCPSQRDEHCA